MLMFGVRLENLHVFSQIATVILPYIIYNILYTRSMILELRETYIQN